MKKLIVVLLLCAAPIFGQQNKTITVIGEASKKFDVNEYVIHVDFKDIVTNVYQNIDPIKKEQVIEEYKNQLEKVGIDFKKFKLNKLYNFSTSTYNRILTYQYITASFEEAKKVLEQRMNGVSAVVDILTKNNTNSDLAILDEMAIKNAIDRANLTAKKINKKIGTIQHIETSPNTNKATSYFNAARPYELQKHYVKVTFALE
ncbi:MULTISPECIES: SIMPL domain-containing protein [Aquimarina]|uniref:SIMPL domain-containing protein n=1 Tax=Aquimarina TaxID=290174 RepID=UPI000D69F55F|nr:MULTISPECIES: SIMPL domain-containing protein [Aquimarina]